MKNLFSLESLQRGTFLWERDSVKSIQNYSELIKNLELKTLIDDYNSENHYYEFISRLRNNSQSTVNTKFPDWVSFFSKLIPKLKLNYPKIPSILNEAYSFPFMYALDTFIYDIKKKSLNVKVIIEEKAMEGIMSWYISRQIEVSSFVLHLVYLQSGLNYIEWNNLFKVNKFDINPWFKISEEYPVLIRFLHSIDKNCRESIFELIDRFAKDRLEIETVFNIPKEVSICDLQSGLSDPHRGGRSVIRLEFSNKQSLIYKPKPIKIDEKLNSFVCKNGNNYGIINLNIISKKGYGWAEDVLIFMSSKDKNLKSIGKSSSFFWYLNATDLHSENVFCTKNGVFALDLETLFLPPIKNNISTPKPLWRNHSIYTTLLFDFNFGEKRKQNLSGFNPSPNLNYLGPRIKFEIIDNNVHVKVIDDSENKVEASNFLIGRNISSLIEIEQGFKEVTLEKSKKEILNFILNLDDRIQTRIVFRDTFFYGRILDRIRQPRFLRDGALLSVDLLSLHEGIGNFTEADEPLHQLIDDEILQLLSQDIPYFSNKIGFLDLETSNGLIEDFFLQSGKKHSIDKIEQSESSDIDEQLSLIRISLGEKPINFSINSLKFKEITDLDPLLKASLQIINAIIQSRFSPFEKPARWISMYGDVAANETRIDIGDSSFFSGSWGIIMSIQAFSETLKHHHLNLKIKEFLDEQAKQWNLSLIENLPADYSTLGFTGYGGEIFAQSILISLNKKRWGFLQSHIYNLLLIIEKRIENDDLLDVISGSAGLLLGCEQFLKICDPNFSYVAEKIQQKCVINLLNKAEDNEENYLTWKIPSEKHPLLGYAHGWSGIVCAIGNLSRNTENIQLRKKLENEIKKASKYPELMLSTHGEWKDFRNYSLGPKKLNRSWCHGIPGIIRGLIETGNYMTKPVHAEFQKLFNEFIESVATTNTIRFCCGEMGNIDLLHDLSKVVDNNTREKINIINRTSSLKIINQIKNQKEDFIPELTFPGLFHGISGVIYTICRFYLPNLPSLSGDDIYSKSLDPKLFNSFFSSTKT